LRRQALEIDYCQGLVSEATDWQWSSVRARGAKGDMLLLIDAIEFDHEGIN